MKQHLEVKMSYRKSLLDLLQIISLSEQLSFYSGFVVCIPWNSKQILTLIPFQLMAPFKLLRFTVVPDTKIS